MIRTVIIDDENHVIEELKYQLKDYSKIDIIETFDNPIVALRELGRINPKLILLDIQMPRLSGLDIAKKIRDSLPEVYIIFVTAHSEYSLEAFDVYAIDYILKPIDKKRLRRTIDRVLEMNNELTSDKIEIKKKLYINCFGNFEIYFEGERPIKWRTEKTKEVFMYLLMNNGMVISRDRILDELWEEADSKRAQKQLHNCIYYIRKKLEDYGIDKDIIDIKDFYMMKIGDVCWDIREWNKLIKNPETVLNVREVKELCKGDLLEGFDWEGLVIERNKYKIQVIKVLLSISERFLDLKKYYKSEEAALIAYNENVFDDKVAIQLMKIYKESNQEVKGLMFYKEYKNLLNRELNIEPNKQLVEMFNSL